MTNTSTYWSRLSAGISPDGKKGIKMADRDRDGSRCEAEITGGERDGGKAGKDRTQDRKTMPFMRRLLPMATVLGCTGHIHLARSTPRDPGSSGV